VIIFLDFSENKYFFPPPKTITTNELNTPPPSKRTPQTKYKPQQFKEFLYISFIGVGCRHSRNHTTPTIHMYKNSTDNCKLKFDNCNVVESNDTSGFVIPFV
jgi:hypothetical protein